MNTETQASRQKTPPNHTDSVAQFSKLMKASMKQAGIEIKEWKQHLKNQRRGLAGFIQRNVDKIFLGTMTCFIAAMLPIILLKYTVWPNFPQNVALVVFACGAFIVSLAMILIIIEPFIGPFCSPMPFWEAVYRIMNGRCHEFGLEPGKPLADAYHASYYWTKKRRKKILAMLAIASGCLGQFNLLFNDNKTYRGIFEKIFGIPDDMQPLAFIIIGIVAGIVYLLFVSHPAAWLGHLALFFDKNDKGQ